MATLTELEDALIQADADGDSDAVGVLSAEIESMRGPAAGGGGGSGGGVVSQFFGGANETLGAGEWWQQNMVGPDPVTTPEKIARTTGRSVGYSTQFLGAELAAAKMLLGTVARPVGAAIAGQMPKLSALTSKTGVASRVGRSMINAIHEAPVAVAAGDTLAAFTAGVGQGAAESLYPDSPTASVVGGLAGGLSPALMEKAFSLSLVGRGSKMAIDKVRGLRDPAQATAKAKRTIYPRIQRAISTPEAKAELQRTQQIADELGLAGTTDFTLAQKTNSQQLLADQRAIEANATGASLDAMAARKRGVQAGIAKAQEALSPAAAGDDQNLPETITRAVERRLKGVLSMIGVKQAETEAAMASTVSQVQPAASRADVGARMRSQLLRAKGDRKAALQALAKASGLNENEVTFEFDGLAQRVTDEFDPREFGTRAPSMVAKIKGYLVASRSAADDGAQTVIDLSAAPGAQAAAKAQADAPATFTFRDLQDIRTSISDDLTVAAATAAPDRNRRVRDLLTLRRAVDSYIDEAVPNAIPGRATLADDWKTFRTAWKRDYIDVFEKGRVYRALRSGSRDAFRTSDEMVAQSFLSPTGVKQYFAAGGDPGAFRAAALDSLADKALKPDGTFNLPGMQRWMAKNAESLPPQVQAEFSTTQRVAEQLAVRANTLHVRQARVEDSILARALGRQGRDPDKFIDSAIRNPTLMREVLQTAKSSGTENALRRAVWLRVFPDGEVDLPTIDLMLKSNRKALEVVMGPEHLRRIKTIRDAVVIEGRTPFPQGTAEKDAGLLGRIEEQTGSGVPQISSRVFAVASGRTSSRYVMIDMLSRFLYKQTAKAQIAVMSEALINPAVARDFALALDQSSIDPAKRLSPAVQNRLQGWMLQLGYAPLTDQATDDTEGLKRP